jgi:uncharacterized protein YbjT (DUF2867 family)
MRVLVTGANGFIGSRVVAGLCAAGHQVVAAMRHTASVGASSNIACDFSRDIDPEIWRPRLAGINAVVNCAGILRETGADTFQRVHVDAPLALFRACAAAGVRRVIQLSALGEPQDGEFIASKHRCDRALAELDLDWLVLRPGLVYSAQGAYGGTVLLRALAAMPGVLVLPGDGSQLIRPIALEDLVAAIVAALAQPQTLGQVIELVGPEMLMLREYLSAWRRWFGLRSARVLATPRWMCNAAVAIGEWSGRGPLCRVIGNLLERRRVGGADAPARAQALLGRAPAPLAQSLARQPSDSRDFLQARWYLARPLVLAALAIVWIGSGIVGFSLSHAVAAAALPGWPPLFVRMAALLGSLANIVLGFALLTGWATRRVLGLMLLMVLGYTLLIGIGAPMHWLDPFGGLLKNISIMALIIVLLALDTGRR